MIAHESRNTRFYAEDEFTTSYRKESSDCLALLMALAFYGWAIYFGAVQLEAGWVVPALAGSIPAAGVFWALKGPLQFITRMLMHGILAGVLVGIGYGVYSVLASSI